MALAKISPVQKENRIKQAIKYSVLGFIISAALTALIIKQPLPKFILPGHLISRPIDFIVAIVYLVTFFLFVRLYRSNNKYHTPFEYSMIASLIFGFAAQIYMVHSQKLYDAQFDISHLAKIVSYIFPIFGIGAGIFAMYKKQEETNIVLALRIAEREKAEEELHQSYNKIEQEVKERTGELSSANAKLEGEIAERTLAQKQLQQHISSLNCLYTLSRLIEQPQISLGQLFQETAGLIRNAYQYPDMTCVKITFQGIPYKTDNFEKTELSQYAEIKIKGEKVGNIEVYCVKKKTTDKDILLEEEHDLLKAIAERLGHIADSKLVEEETAAKNHV